MDRLTERQLDVLVCIQEFIDYYGYPPTVRVIAEECGLTVGPAHHHVLTLLGRGYLKRLSEFRTSRNYWLTNKLGFDGKKYYTRVEVT